MAEAFTAGVKMGGLTNDTEIRILLCYLIKSVGPVTREAMEAALLQEELVNSFEFVGARESAILAVIRIQSWVHKAAQNHADIEKDGDRYRVTCTIQDKNQQHGAFTLQVTMPDAMTAEQVRDHFVACGSEIYNKVLNLLTQPLSDEQRPPEGVR